MSDVHHASDAPGPRKKSGGKRRARSRRPWRRTTAAALGLTVCLGTASVSVASGSDPDAKPTAPTSSRSSQSPKGSAGRTKPTIEANLINPGDDWTSSDAADYWTPQRMAAAAPPADAPPADAPPADGTAEPDGVTARSAPAAKPAKAQPARRARHFDGIPTVGVLFSVDGDAKAHHCTASVVNSPRRNLILTAGHCEPGANAAFVPQYRSGADTQPYGVWAISKTFAYPGRGTTGSASDLDFAFATVEPDELGREIEEVTGGNTLSATPGYTNKVTVTGYPSVRNDPKDRAVSCDTRTSRLAGTRQLRMECGGFYGGTSGSPWLAGFDKATGTGRVIGLIGGLNGGGPKGPDSDRISYSPYFGTSIFTLYARATSG
ncbi:hypothetical protein FCH28_10330 [Streptomyces piniterrae]|uniref:Trypsin-like serine protease n=1 Tax=Streptomyces piniterrae TaxID=2571125 RepID=A0A4U0NMU1_9ACTN|nr:hypothetical protein [Streptomyces piniterrae]TJZ55707.1 hypothetical protein FCH28_10330 [Streptomyces piniterrae]